MKRPKPWHRSRSNMRPRGACSVCGCMVAITAKGNAPHHTRPSAYQSNGLRCAGSGRPVAEKTPAP